MARDRAAASQSRQWRQKYDARALSQMENALAVFR
jgi:hypothetical protein